jgi:hypothetical protein
LAPTTIPSAHHKNAPGQQIVIDFLHAPGFARIDGRNHFAAKVTAQP